MIRLTTRVLVWLSISSAALLHTEQLIILTFHPYPISNDMKSAKEFANHLEQPGKKAYNRLRSFFEDHDVVSGIFCTYAGFITVSNRFGQAIFPKVQTAPKLHLLITPKLIPIPLVGNTIHHWELAADAPAHLFVIQQKHDPVSEQYFWQIENADIASTLPNAKEIPVDTIVVFGLPKHFFVPTGITVESPPVSTHFLLPPVYVKKGIGDIERALYVLNLKYLFRKPIMLYQQAPYGYSTLLNSR